MVTPDDNDADAALRVRASSLLKNKPPFGGFLYAVTVTTHLVEST